MSALARWCYRHRNVVVALWVVLLVALGGATAAKGTAYQDVFNLPGTDSSKALDLLTEALPQASGDADQIVLHVDSGSLQDSEVQTRVSTMLTAVSKLPSVTSLVSPYDAAGAAQVSADGRTAYATVQFDAQAMDLPVDDIQKVIDTAQDARGDGLQVELSGQAISQLSKTPPASTELIGIAAAAVILFVAFGSLLGMLVPILVAIAGVGAGLLSIGLLSHGVTLGSIAPTLAALIGLGVGIDYALFIVTRYRSGLAAGHPPEEAVVRALNTSGRAVIFAGTTVVIALLGLLVLRLNFTSGLGIGAAVAVVWTVIASVTLMPAMLSFFGDKLLTRKQRTRLRTEGPLSETPPGFWLRWAERVARRRVLFSAAAIVVIAVLSIPTLSLRLGSSDAGNDPSSSTTRKAYDLLADGFGPGFNGPLQLVAEIPGAGDAQAVDGLVADLQKTKGVAAVQAVPLAPGAKLAIIQVVPTTSPQSEATNQLIDRIRDDVVPAAEQGTTMQVYVGGFTAIFKDFASVLTGKLPLFIGVVIGLGFLLLMLAFRSIVVPLTAAAMNLLATAASFGVVTAVFQWGWGSELIGAGAAGPVEAFLPVIMLAILFGLSMDYQVFLVSRMHEEWAHTGDNKRSVIIGQAATGRVITAAALIMISVFGSFVLGGQRVIAEFGVGLAAAVAIDAFVLRTVLVPALMHAFGPANWWLPAWLDRVMPHLSVDPPDEPVETPQPVPVGAAGGSDGGPLTLRAAPRRRTPGGPRQRLAAAFAPYSRGMEDHPAPSRRDAVVALLVLGVCLLPFLVIGGSAMLVFRPAGFLVAASAAGSLVLVVRRRHPWPVWVATTVIGLSAVAVGGGPTSAYLPAIVALYTVSERSSTGRAVLVALVSAVAPVVLIIGFGRHGAVDSVAFGMTAWSAVGVMSGLAVRNQLAVVASAHERARLAEAGLEEEAQRRVTEERLRIARDLHDVMAHHVSVINVQAGVASYLVHSDPDGAAEAMVHVREASQTVLGEVASILGLLRSVDDGLETAPTPSLGDVDALVERARRAGVQVVLQSTGGPRDLPPIIDLTGYRVVQEALTNAARHGSGRVVVLVDTGGDEVVIEVRNPRSGVAVAHDAPGGHGIAGMGERVLAAGGSLVAGPEGPDAWLVRATLPVTARDQPGVVRRVESGAAR